MPVRQPNENVKLVKVSKTKRKSLSSKNTVEPDQHAYERGRLSQSGGKCHHCLEIRTGTQGPDAEGLSA